MSWHLSLKTVPTLRADLRSLSPAALAGLSAAEIERLPIGHGNTTLPLGELFAVAPRDGDELLFEGDLALCDRIGWQLAAGAIRVDGDVGDYLGCGMTGGSVQVSGNAGLLAACELSGGTLTVHGDVGDFAASALPGNMDGMRGGRFTVLGSAGARFGDRMRRGTALVFGAAGDFVASRMVAGTIGVAGSIGAHAGFGMRRGTLLLCGPAPALSPTFAGTSHNTDVFWSLLLRDVAHAGGAFAGLASRRPRRLVGDLAAGGKGELLLVA